MFEESPESVFNERNPKRLVETVTYVMCNGEKTENSEAIHALWNSVINTYISALEKSGKEPSLITRRNMFGADHVTKDIDEAGKTSSRAELFFTAIDSLIFAERYTDSGVESTYGGNKNYSYAELEAEKVKDSDKIKANISHAEINFRGQDGKFNGTTLIVKNGSLMLRQRVGNDDFPVLEITRDKERDLTQMVVFIETDTGSRKIISVDSTKVFGNLKDAILWGNTYPYPQSVNAFTQGLVDPGINDGSLVKHLDDE